MLSRLVPAAVAEPSTTPRTNWAGNYTFQAEHLYEPTTVEEVQHLVRTCSKLRALGRGHSFNGIADSTTNQVTLKNLQSIELDASDWTVKVGSGISYGQLAPVIDAKGWAVHNLASLPHVSVVGACATATHGSGLRNGCLSTSMSAIEFVAGDGTLHTLSRAVDGERFEGAVVNLGALGIVTSATLEIEPSFQVAQSVYENLSFAELEHNLEAIFLSGYSVSLFTDWQNHRATQVWVKRRVEPDTKPDFAPELFGAIRATRKLHPLGGHSAENCTDQLGVPGPWYERLPHFRMNFTPSSGAELQTEYLVPLEHGYKAILAIEELRDQITPHLFIAELRAVAADNLWTSMAYKRPSMAIHFTWKPEWPEVSKLLPQIEARLAPFHARPHWAKLNSIPADRIRKLYPRMAEFEALASQYDPGAKFRNHYLENAIYKA